MFINLITPRILEYLPTDRRVLSCLQLSVPHYQLRYSILCMLHLPHCLQPISFLQYLLSEFSRAEQSRILDVSYENSTVMTRVKEVVSKIRRIAVQGYVWSKTKFAKGKGSMSRGQLIGFK